MLKNSSPLKKYLIYNRISGSCNLIGWLLMAALIITSKLINFNQDWIEHLITIGIFFFPIVVFVSTILFIFKSFSIEKTYKKEKNVVLFSLLTLIPIIGFVFNFLIRRKFKSYKK